MRSPSKAMLRSPARGGHGSTMCMILLVATASPAAKLTVSRWSRYTQPLRRGAVASASIAPRKLFRDINGLSLGDVEDVADRGRTPVGAAAQPALHRHGDFRLTKQEELGIVRRLCAVERRAQHVAGPGGAHKVRRHDDDEVGFLLLKGGAARECAEHRHVANPRELLLVGGVGGLEKARDCEALAVAQLDRRVGA